MSCTEPVSWNFFSNLNTATCEMFYVSGCRALNSAAIILADRPPLLSSPRSRCVQGLLETSFITWNNTGKQPVMVDIFLWGHLKDLVYQEPIRDFQKQNTITSQQDNVGGNGLHRCSSEIKLVLNDISHAPLPI